MCRRPVVPALLALLMASTAGNVEAQNFGSLLVGPTTPYGDFADSYDPGISLRLESGVEAALVGAHATAGWSRFGAAGSGGEDADVFDVGLGARLILGPLFAGVNGAYFFGDGEDGFGFVPNVGGHLLFLEAILEARVDGEQWWSVKVGIRS